MLYQKNLPVEIRAILSLFPFRKVKRTAQQITKAWLCRAVARGPEPAGRGWRFSGFQYVYFVPSLIGIIL